MLLEGSPGVGKTSLVSALARATGVLLSGAGGVLRVEEECACGERPPMMTKKLSFYRLRSAVWKNSLET